MLIRSLGFTGDRTMKKLALAFILLSSTFLFGASDKPNPADFAVKVHVVSSASQQTGGDTRTFYVQVLESVIDNQPVELQGSSQGVLALGDYPARVSAAVHAPNKHPNSYDTYQGYDLLMPDGTTRTYTVTRLGPAPANL
jgi:hypothetical protein